MLYGDGKPLPPHNEWSIGFPAGKRTHASEPDGVVFPDPRAIERGQEGAPLVGYRSAARRRGLVEIRAAHQFLLIER